KDVISSSCSRLGGRDFGEILFQHFVEKFKVEYKIDVLHNGRACLWLRAACEKLKKVLSANPEAPMNIECLMEDKDVRGAKVPAVIKILAEFFGKEPRRTMNASVQESFPFSIALTWKGAAQDSQNKTVENQHSIVFPKGNPIPSVKAHTFFRLVPSKQQMPNVLIEEEEAEVPVTKEPSKEATKMDTDNASADIGPFQATNAERGKVKVKARLNLHGIVSVDSAQLIEEEEAEVPFNETDVNMDDAPTDTKVEALKKKVKKSNIPVSEVVYGAMLPADVQQAEEKEFEMALQDRVMEETKDKKNAVEGYVYDMSNKDMETENESEDTTSSNVGVFESFPQAVTERIFSYLRVLQLAQMRSVSKGVNGEDIQLLASYRILFLFEVSSKDRKCIRLLLVNILSSTTTPIPKPDELHFQHAFDISMVPYSPNSSVLGFRILYVQLSPTNQPFFSVYTSRSRDWEIVCLSASLVPTNQALQRNDGRALTFMLNQDLISILSNLILFIKTVSPLRCLGTFWEVIHSPFLSSALHE
nr:hypothetical protein [Tanacetum cinerariifolium]